MEGVGDGPESVGGYEDGSVWVCDGVGTKGGEERERGGGWNEVWNAMEFDPETVKG